VLFWLRSLFAVFLGVALTVTAGASRVSPMIVELEPVGRDSIARIDLVNDGLRDLPYEVQMMRGAISPEGQLQLSPADEEFVVFPAQAIVESNSQQVFRIQYVGDGAREKSEIFYMAIRQIPVGFEDGVTQVQMVVNYNVLVNVVPDGSEPKATVRSAAVSTRQISGPTDAADPTAEPTTIEQRGIEVDVGNEGSKFYLAGLADWSFSGTTASGEPFQRNYRGDEASRSIGVGVVGPEANRIFFFPTDVDVDPDSLKIEINP